MLNLIETSRNVCRGRHGNVVVVFDVLSSVTAASVRTAGRMHADQRCHSALLLPLIGVGPRG